MEEIDYNQISELLLQKTNPVYVFDEETKQIIFTNQVLDEMMGCSLAGENCYKAFFGDANSSSISPPERPTGETYQWDYADKKTGKLFKVMNLWFKNKGRRCRMGVITDTSDLMDLNRSMADYLWLTQRLSELQMKMAKEPQNSLPPLLCFFRDHYNADSAAISFFENGNPRTVMADEAGIHDLQAFYNSSVTPFGFTVSDRNFSLWLENVRRAEAWEEDRAFVISIAKVYIENSMLWQRLAWENCHDKLTGLLSRATLDGYIRDAYNSQESLGILYMDVDELKRTNDFFGHEMGDTLIKKAADILKAVSGDNVNAFRMGGDEFMLVCIGYTPERLDALATTIGGMVADANIASAAPYLSLSLGKAFGKQPFTFEALMRTADKRMYDIKNRKKEKLKSQSAD